MTIFPFFLLLLPIKANGQQKIDGFSINPKVGFYSNFESGGFTGGVEFSILKNNISYAIDYYHYDEFTFLGPEPSEYYNQIGAMVGKYEGNRLFRFQYQGGFASFWGIKRTELIEMGFLADRYDYSHFLTLGLITKVGFKFIPSQYFSIGIDLQSNINLKNTVFMPMLSMEIGKLRGKIQP